jgi:enoyl-CoA hydratase
MKEIMTGNSVCIEMSGEIAVLRLDDGRVNAFTRDSVDELRRAMAGVAASATAVVVTARSGYFSAGLDRSVILGTDRGSIKDLLRAVTSLYDDVLSFPLPVVAACTGHAVAAGALLLLCCDYRVAARGEAKIGLTEVAAGVPLFPLAVAVARTRLSNTDLVTALLEGRAYPVRAAQTVGYVDEVCEPTEIRQRAVAAATRLAGFDRAAFLTSRRLIWESARDEVRRAVAARHSPAPG